MDAYFSHLNQQLKTAAGGRPAILLDLDRLDHNIHQIRAALGEPLRVVTKSLPCLQLLDYILSETDCQKLMVFHQPYLPLLLSRFPDASILMGKPLLVEGVAEVLAKLDRQNLQVSLDRIEWLVDTPMSLKLLGQLARREGVQFNVSMEIDIGLGRGGITGSFSGMRDVLNEFPGHLHWSGLMGYDAHVPFVGDDIDVSFDAAMQTYNTLMQQALNDLPDQDRPLTFNSGGSQTYDKFKDRFGPVNDVSVGSAFLKPARFGRLSALQAALFIAAPTLKQFARPTPSRSSPELDTISYIYGGGWPGDIIWPEGLKRSRHDDAPNENLMPNQSVCFKSSRLNHSIGDYVFFHPSQSDAMFQFEDIHVCRGGALVDCWQPIPRRY